MDFCRNVSVTGGKPSEYQSEPVLGNLNGSLDDLFSAQNTEVDVSLEWLSIFVEDCFSSTGHSFPITGTTVAAAATAKAPGSAGTEPSKHLNLQKKNNNKGHLSTKQPLQQFVFPSKARTKRRKKIINAMTTAMNTGSKSKSCWVSSDPPLLQQAYWLADSELISPPKREESSLVPTHHQGYQLLKEESQEEVKSESNDEEEEEEEEEEEGEMTTMTMEGGGSNGGGGQARRCTHCLSQKTPQWRAGPLGPKTLCNACGVRYKSGRLLPEYRPAKSPTFVSYLHSNSHKKVLEMRMGPP